MKKLSLLFLLLLSMNVYAQETDKTVTLVVSGQGKTPDVAKQNALRSAIEQAFGTFISSKTEILNNVLIKDEIVSVSNGNIKNFEILSSTKLSEALYTVLVNATISINKLSSFVQNKGYESSFNGESFGMNIKLQKLNELAEAKAVLNTCYTLNEILKKSIDFKLTNSEPQSVDGKSDEFKVALKISWSLNNNYQIFKNYVIDVLPKIAMTDEEEQSYVSLNKDIYRMYIFGSTYTFRNQLSIIQLKNLFLRTNQYLYNFKIVSEAGEISTDVSLLFNNNYDEYGNYVNNQNKNESWEYNGIAFPNVYMGNVYSRFGDYFEDESWSRCSSWSIYAGFMENLNKRGLSFFFNNLNYSNQWFDKLNNKSRMIIDKLAEYWGSDPVLITTMNDHSYNKDERNRLILRDYPPGNTVGQITLTKTFLLTELEKITKFKVLNLNSEENRETGITKSDTSTLKPLKDTLNAYIKEKNFIKCEEILSALINEEPANSYYYSFLGVIYRIQRKYDKAYDQFYKSLKLVPKNLETVFYLSNCYLSDAIDYWAEVKNKSYGEYEIDKKENQYYYLLCKSMDVLEQYIFNFGENAKAKEEINRIKTSLGWN